MSTDKPRLKLMLFGEAAWQFEDAILLRFPDAAIVRLSDRDVSGHDCSEVTCAIGWRFPPGLFSRMPALKWIQSIAVGVEDWIADPSIASDVVVTNTKGLYADEVAEYIIWAASTLSRRFHVAIKNQSKRRWRQVGGIGIAGKTIGIAGMGHVGRATAVRARSIGMRVLGICRNPDDPNVSGLVDHSVSTGDMDEILGDLDVLAACLPLTQETRGLFGKERIARLKEGAIVVNSAREAIFDYTSLAKAARQGRLSGVALDVFDVEPLRRGNRLWKIENVLVTPHVSALTHAYHSKVANLIDDNLDRLMSGKPLECQVNRAVGY